MRRLLVPLLILATALVADRAGWSWLESTTFPWRDAQNSALISRAIAGLVIVLAWRLRRGRIAWATLAVALVAEASGRWSSVSTSAAAMDVAALQMAALLLPINLAVVSWLREWWVMGKTGLWRFAALGAQTVGVFYIATHQNTAAVLAQGIAHTESWLRSLVLPVLQPPNGGTSLALVLVLVWALAVSVAGAAFIKRRSPLEAGLVGAIVASGLALWPMADGSQPHRFYFTVALVILGTALIENAFRLAFVDALTALPARRALEERLDQLGRDYAIAMLDLDHFKKFNDRHGHEVGDQILRLVAARLAKVGGGGEAFRYGGEEFTIVFAGLSAKDSQPHLEALRRNIGGGAFTVRSPSRTAKKNAKKTAKGTAAVRKQLKVTVSIGVAERSERYGSPEQVIKAADRALYKAKKAGRNRVAMAPR